MNSDSIHAVMQISLSDPRKNHLLHFVPTELQVILRPCCTSLLFEKILRLLREKGKSKSTFMLKKEKSSNENQS